MSFFAERRRQIFAAVAASPQRFVAADLSSLGLAAEQLDAALDPGATSLAPVLPERLAGRFPWAYPLAFRSGTLVALAVPQPPAAGPSADGGRE